MRFSTISKTVFVDHFKKMDRKSRNWGGESPPTHLHCPPQDDQLYLLSLEIVLTKGIDLSRSPAQNIGIWHWISGSPIYFTSQIEFSFPNHLSLLNIDDLVFTVSVDTFILEKSSCACYLSPNTMLESCLLDISELRDTPQ